MSTLVCPTKLDQPIALEWLRESLSQGHLISQKALSVVEERGGHSYALVPRTVDPSRLANPGEGGVIGAGSVQRALSSVFDSLMERGGACAVVEDELRRRSDPNPDLVGLLPTAFFGDRVIHWAVLGDDSESALKVLQRGSHGYPTNAFVSSATVDELGLVEDMKLHPKIADNVADSLVAVIVAAYDAETYLIWEPM